MVCGSAVSQPDVAQGGSWVDVYSLRFSLTSSCWGYALSMEVHSSVGGMFRASVQMVFINISLTKANQAQNKGWKVPSVHHEAMAMAGTFNFITGREWRIESNNPTHRTILMFRITSHQPLNHTCSFGLFWTPRSAWLGLSTEISSHCHGISYRENVCSRLFWCPPCNHSPAAVSVGC